MKMIVFLLFALVQSVAQAGLARTTLNAYTQGGKSLQTAKLPFTEIQGKILWDTRKISVGVYLYTCKQGSNNLAVGKLSVQH